MLLLSFILKPIEAFKPKSNASYRRLDISCTIGFMIALCINKETQRRTNGYFRSEIIFELTEKVSKFKWYAHILQRKVCFETVAIFNTSSFNRIQHIRSKTNMFTRAVIDDQSGAPGRFE